MRWVGLRYSLRFLKFTGTSFIVTKEVLPSRERRSGGFFLLAKISHYDRLMVNLKPNVSFSFHSFSFFFFFFFFGVVENVDGCSGED